MTKPDFPPQQDVSLTDEGKTAELPVAPRWYCVSREGVATLCDHEADAKETALRSGNSWPQGGPHRAVCLVDAGGTEGRSAHFWRNRAMEHGVENYSLRTTLEIALVALEYHRDQTRPTELSDEAISALRLVVGPNDQANGHCPRRTDDDH